MPEVMTRADSLREYLTGAVSDGAAQADPDASLGGYRAGDEATSVDVTVTNPISGITIDYVAGANPDGAGTLDAVDADTLRWKCYGGDYGDSVAIANGETKLLESLADPGAFLRVSRTSAAALVGTATVTLAQQRNNLFGFDDVAADEAAAGDTEYRATILVNESAMSVGSIKRWVGELATARTSDGGQLGSSGAGTITTTGSLADWPASGFCHLKNGAVTREIVYYSSRTSTVLTVPAAGRGLLGTSAAAGGASDTMHAVPGIALGIDADGVTAGGAAIQTVANENTEPAGVSWVTGIDSATGLNIGSMATTEQVGLWIKRESPAGLVATSEAEILIQESFDTP